MSNTIPNSVAPEVEAIEVEKELPETMATVEPTEEEQVAPKKKGFLPGNIPPGGLRKDGRCCIMSTLITDISKGELHEPYKGASEEEQTK